MKLHTVAKIGGVVSIILFLIGVGMYGFAKLSEAGQGKNVDLLTLVPHDCVGVLETDNLDYFSNEFPKTSYAEFLTSHQKMGVIRSIINDLTQFSSLGAHRLGNQMNHLMISFHAPYNAENVVVYFKMHKDTKRLLSKIFSEREGGVLPKIETYRGENISIYPMRKMRFVTVYSGKGFLVVSYQKRLIERVIDAKKDKTSLRHDENFSGIRHNKSANYMTFYAKTPAVPMLCKDVSDCWNEFEIHLNSDVFYLTGALYSQPQCLKTVKRQLERQYVQSDSRCLLVVGQHQVDSCISEAIISPHNALVDECVSTLSRDASCILVADLGQVNEDSAKYSKYIPVFVMQNLSMFDRFILSVQVTEFNDRLSHILVFTYKD